MKVAAIAAVMVASVSIASCVSSKNSAAENAEIAYSNLCAVEPSVYLAYMTYAATHNISDKTRQRVDAGHVAFTRLCTDRPTNLITGLHTLSAAYADVVSYNKS